MKLTSLAAALCAAVLFSACGKSEDSGSGSGGGSSSGGNSGGSSTINPSGLDASKDLSAELKTLMEATYAMAKSGDAKLDETVKSFFLQNHDSWLKKTFGDEVGGAWAQKYGERASDFEPGMKGLFEKVVKDEKSGITVFRLTDPDDRNATGSQKDSMLAMKEKTALYTVKFIKPGDELGMSVWSWAYVDGGFRMIAKK
ncbi:MAG: hypothetical protein HUU15_06435 [Candidatus Brocadiae bacterium]|nr:hypothetical protein [Candidatus Brocadiia bacterium]